MQRATFKTPALTEVSSPKSSKSWQSTGKGGRVEKALIFPWPEKERATRPLDAPSPFPPEAAASVYTQRCRLQSRQER